MDIMLAKKKSQRTRGRKMFNRYQGFILKNTLAILGPIMAVFAVLAVILMKYPVMEKLECENINDATDYNGRLEAMYQADAKLATYDAKNLYYTGYDYYIEDELKGAYYYSTDNGYMCFYIIETTNPESYIHEHSVKGEIINDKISVPHIVSKLVSAAGIKEEMVENYYTTYVISELDYPAAYITLMKLLSVSPWIVCGLILFYVLLIIVFPAVHSQSEQLNIYGSPRRIIKEINYELKNKLLYKRANVYITHNYMIVSYLLKTLVVKLDEVKYLSKNLVEKKVGLGMVNEVYRLTISNPGILFHEVDFVDEDFIDKVVENIRGI